MNDVFELFEAYQPWAQDAACEGSDVHVLPDGERERRGSWVRRQAAREAKLVCESCPVRLECLEEGFKVDRVAPLQGVDSIYGGLLFEERRELAARLLRGERDLWSAQDAG